MTNTFELLNEVFSSQILNLRFDNPVDIIERFARWASCNPCFGYSIDFYHMEINVVLFSDNKMKSYSYVIIEDTANKYRIALKNIINYNGNFNKNA